MSDLPKLKVNWSFGQPSEKTCDLKQAKDFLFDYGEGILVIVEGQLIHSYEELVQLATQDCYKDREVLSVMLFPVMVVGG